MVGSDEEYYYSRFAGHLSCPHKYQNSQLFVDFRVKQYFTLGHLPNTAPPCVVVQHPVTVLPCDITGRLGDVAYHTL